MTMFCKKCGGKTITARDEETRPTVLDIAMSSYTRRRLCKCGAQGKTVEVWSEDLAELRRKAYLYELSEAQPA